jgi:hypothetical protein
VWASSQSDRIKKAKERICLVPWELEAEKKRLQKVVYYQAGDKTWELVLKCGKKN